MTFTKVMLGFAGALELAALVINACKGHTLDAFRGLMLSCVYFTLSSVF